MSTYGEQRYKENIKDLTPEQKARQTLALEAFKEQVAYERSQRRKIAKAAKDTFKGLVSLIILGMVAVMFFSCEAEDTLICTTYDLGAAPEGDYTAMDICKGDRSLGPCAVVYVYEGRIKQDVCPCDGFKG
jgi:hypothetical protein